LTRVELSMHAQKKPPCTITHKVSHLQSVHIFNTKEVHLFAPTKFPLRTGRDFFSGSASHRAIPSSCLSHENSNPSRTQTLRAHTSPPSASLKPHNQSHALRPPKPAASSRASPQLRAHPLNCIHDVERPLRNRRLSLPHRRSVIRFHGARIPTRGFTVLME